MKKKILYTISFKLLALTLVFAILTPTIIKFAHGFQDHEHEICIGESTSHFHELDIDCEFYKFKLNTQYVHILKPIDVLELETYQVDIKSEYKFFSDFKKLQTSLRGPPSII